MLRKLIDYKKLDHELAAFLIESYPDGYGDDDIITFKTMNGEIIETVEIKTKDTIYLVKISKSLANFISNFEDNIEKELDNNDEPVLEVADTIESDLQLNTYNESEEDPDFD